MFIRAELLALGWRSQIFFCSALQQVTTIGVEWPIHDQIHPQGLGVRLHRRVGSGPGGRSMRMGYGDYSRHATKLQLLAETASGEDKADRVTEAEAAADDAREAELEEKELKALELLLAAEAGEAQQADGDTDADAAPEDLPGSK